MATFLFQGDSITDVGRKRGVAQPNKPKALGNGYVRLIVNELVKRTPQNPPDCYNRGVSGDRVVDLYARWKIDGVNLRPDLISILIGVNDTWHEFGSQNGVEIARYEIVYRLLLDYTLEKLPTVQLVLCEPFVLPCGVVTAAWQDEMDQRRAIVQKLAQQYNSLFVPFQQMFTNALAQHPASYWAEDGVHPTDAGHQLMADRWLDVVGPLLALP